jgi:hypothetical protein
MGTRAHNGCNGPWSDSPIYNGRYDGPAASHLVTRRPPFEREEIGMSQQAELFTPGRRLTQLAQQKPDEIALVVERQDGGADTLTRL